MPTHQNSIHIAGNIFSQKIFILLILMFYRKRKADVHLSRMRIKCYTEVCLHMATKRLHFRR